MGEQETNPDGEVPVRVDAWREILTTQLEQCSDDMRNTTQFSGRSLQRSVQS